MDFIEKSTNNKISGEYNHDLIIDEVLFLEDDKLLSHSTLYLTTQIEKALLIKEYNVLVVVDKRSKNTQVLQLETRKSIDEIYKVICEFMFKKYKLYEKKCNI